MLSVPARYRKRSGSSSSRQWMTMLDRGLDILGIPINTTNNNHVFETTSDKEFTTIHEPEIARTNVNLPVVGIQTGLERLVRFFFSFPITQTATRAVDPNLTDLIIRQ